MALLPTSERRLTRAGLAGAILIASALAPALASGQPAPAPPAPAPAELPAAPADPPAAVPATGPLVPADQARGWEEEPGIESEDVALFLPRAVLFFPRILLTGLFWPVRHGLRWVERHAVIPRVKEVFYNDAGTAAILPAFSFQTFLGASIGATAFHDDVAGHGESLSLDVRYGGRYGQAYQLRFAGDRVGGTHLWLESLVRFETNPRLLFQGYGDRDEQTPESVAGGLIGPRDAAVETRYSQTRLLNLLRIGYTFGDPGSLLKLGGTGILNHRDFDSSTEEPEPSIEQVYDVTRLTGFEEGTRTLELNANLVVDTRDVHGATSSGVYFDAFGGGVLPSHASRYAHYGAELTTYWNLYRKTRVLVVRAAHEGIAADEDEVPFVDLPRLGGPLRLRGYTLDQFRDKLTAVGTLEYHYPIHEMLAGSIFMDAGHVARDYSGLVSFEDWRLGGGGGLILRSKKSVIFTIDVAYGDGLNVYLTTDPLRAFDRRSEQL